MIQVLSNPDVLFVVNFLGCILAVLVLGCWYISRKTGRPLRDMLAVLAGGIVVVIVTVPLAIRYSNPAQKHASPTEYVLFTAVALTVWWAFNKLARGRSKSSRSLRKHQAGEHRSTEGNSSE